MKKLLILIIMTAASTMLAQDATAQQCKFFNPDGKQCLMKGDYVMDNGFCHSHTPRKKCNGITSKGAPCKSIMVMADGYCRAHSPSTVRCNAKKTDGKPCRMAVKTLGDHCHLHTVTF